MSRAWEEALFNSVVNRGGNRWYQIPADRIRPSFERRLTIIDAYTMHPDGDSVVPLSIGRPVDTIVRSVSEGTPYSVAHIVPLSIGMPIGRVVSHTVEITRSRNRLVGARDMDKNLCVTLHTEKDDGEYWKKTRRQLLK